LSNAGCIEKMVCVELTLKQIEFLLVRVEQIKQDENNDDFEENLRNRNTTNLIESEIQRNGFCHYLSFVDKKFEPTKGTE